MAKLHHESGPLCSIAGHPGRHAAWVQLIRTINRSLEFQLISCRVCVYVTIPSTLCAFTDFALGLK